MSTSEPGTSRQAITVIKWTEEQTAVAAAHHGIDPNDLTLAHFMALGLESEEIIQVDHEAGTVTRTDAEGQRHTVSIEDWNREH